MKVEWVLLYRLLRRRNCVGIKEIYRGSRLTRLIGCLVFLQQPAYPSQRHQTFVGVLT